VTLLNLDDLVGDQTVGLTMDLLGGLLARGIH
jgi:hypothetical protein